MPLSRLHVDAAGQAAPQQALSITTLLSGSRLMIDKLQASSAALLMQMHTSPTESISSVHSTQIELTDNKVKLWAAT
jgi:hypothetical protein